MSTNDKKTEVFGRGLLSRGLLGGQTPKRPSAPPPKKSKGLPMSSTNKNKTIDQATLQVATEKYGAEIAAEVLGKGGSLEDCKTAYAQKVGISPGMAAYAGSINQSLANN